MNNWQTKIGDKEYFTVLEKWDRKKFSRSISEIDEERRLDG